jgi:hypothetical protein
MSASPLIGPGTASIDPLDNVLLIDCPGSGDI